MDKQQQEVAGPSLDDVTNAVCPDSRPYKCLPYGNCYGYDSYCNPNSRTVESCFPHNLSTNESVWTYCQEVGQNVSKMLHPSCQFSCMTRFGLQRSENTVYEKSASCSDVPMWLVAVFVAAIVIVVFQVIWCLTRNTHWRKTISQKVTLTCLHARADGYVPPADHQCEEGGEQTDYGVQFRGSGNHADDVRVNLQHPDTDVHVCEVPRRENQIQNQQQGLVVQHVLENTNDSSHLQQPFLNNRHEEMSQSSHSSGNDSSISSPSSSASSFSTNNDSGISSGREGQIDHMNLVQQSPQTQVFTNQDCGIGQQTQNEHRPGYSIHLNASIPDEESEIVTSASAYRE